MTNTNELDMINRTTFLARAAAFILALCPAFSCDNNSDDPDNPGDETVTVVLDNASDGLYFGNFWKEGYADYYFILSKGEIGYSSDDYIAPLNPGDYILHCDLWGEISKDHSNPIVPEGTYTAHSGRANGTFNLELTFAMYNKEKVSEGMYRVENVLFSDGEFIVKHIAEGYSITANVTTTDGVKMTFTYSGAITLADKSGEGDSEVTDSHIRSNLALSPKRVTKQLYSSDEASGYDNYVLRCFDTEKITSDGLYPSGAGHKLQIDLYVAHGEDLAGTYTIGKRLEYKAGTFYPGMWFGTQTLGTFCMQVNSTSDIKFCAISDGKVDIVKNADETYSVTFALTDEDGYNVSGSWTGNIEDFAVVTEPETNLESDVVMTPTQCSSANYYGDYYATGSANYGIVFNTDDETLAIDFIAASGDASEIPAGTYTVASGNDAWTVCPGSIGFTSAEPSCYIQYETTGLSTDAKYKAPIVAGTMTVSKTGSTYTFEFEFYDDYDLADKTLTPHKISGKYTGTIPAITDYTKLQ